ncbi:MAG: class I tRNA ligase family protein, partial [Candidatus Pacebacteria bacterium]|nr:class I tRNA ligase family protein [Candidatus Paceibacterota bacterium]
MSTFQFVLLELSKCIAPVMPFIAERIYLSITKDKESVHLEKYPIANNINLEVIQGMKEIRIICSDGLMLRQKNNINVRQPLQSITINRKIHQQYIEIIKDELN